MKLVHKFILMFTFVVICIGVSAQYDYPGENVQEHKARKKLRSEDSRLFFGGNFGLMFGRQYGYVEISPYVGYKITPRLWAGGGPKYMYFKQGSLKTSIYGINSFASFAILDKINETTNLGIGSVFLYLENEVLSIEPIYYDLVSGYYYYDPRAWYDILLGGVGIRIPLGRTGGFSIIALWGLTDSAELLYSNPEIRITFDF